jgi:hypothetical protein
MTEKDEDKVKQLETSLRIMSKQISDLYIRGFAMQSFLQQSGLFSKDELELRVSEIAGIFSSGVEQILADRTAQEEIERRERLRKLLESYEGPKH